MASKLIPNFPEFLSIFLETKDAMDSFLLKNRPASSEYTFSNLFCWQKCCYSKATIINDNLCLFVKDTKGDTYFMQPVGSNKIEETLKTCAKYLKDNGFNPKIIRINEEFAANFKDKPGYILESDRDHSDYIYLTEELISLKGKKFDGKRNRISKFQRENKFKCINITQKEIPQCFDLLGRWKADKKGDGIDEPIEEALNSFGQLDLKGVAVVIGGRIEAFAIGEKISSDTAVEYFEVANAKYAGLPQFVNQKFCGLWPDCKYINREQDLGDKGLKKAKLSYKPDRLLTKFNMIVKV